MKISRVSLTRRDFLYFIMIAGVLLLGYYVRMCFLPDKIAKINILTTFPSIVLFLDSARHREHLKKNIFFIIMLSAISFLYIVTQMQNQRSVMNTLLYLVNLIMPLFIISLDIKPQCKKKVFCMFVITMDCLVFLMFFMLLIDVVTHNKAISAFAHLSGDSNLIVFSNPVSNREASIMGHYLPTAEIYIIYYVIHYFARHQFKTMYIVSMIISLIGISFAASKGGIVLIIALILVFNIKDFKMIFCSLAALSIAYALGFFSAVINRFAGNSLTSGRSEMWTYLNKIYDDLTPLVYGHGSESTHWLNQKHEWASAAFEYPFRAFAYEYGIIFTILFYIIVFVYPCLRLLKERRFDHLIGFAAVFLYCNTYNGWALGYDYMFLYCIFTFVVLNLDEMADYQFILRFFSKKLGKQAYKSLFHGL